MNGHFQNLHLRYETEYHFATEKEHQSFFIKLQKRNSLLLFYTILQQFCQSIHLVGLAGSSQPKFD